MAEILHGLSRIFKTRRLPYRTCTPIGQGVHSLNTPRDMFYYDLFWFMWAYQQGGCIFFAVEMSRLTNSV